MVLFNYSTRELTAKIVYYGPGLCGKTTNLQFIYESLPDNVKKGKMLSLATKTDRTLFFDFLPIELGKIRGMKTRVQLYTVPGQVFYNSTRKLVLKGADGVVFIADSQAKMVEANVESYKNLEDNLREMGLRIEETPLVMQFNKRDLPHLASIEEMNTQINRHNAPFYEAVATTGIGVEDTLKAITKLVLNNLAAKYKLDGAGMAPEAEAPSRPVSEPAAADLAAQPARPSAPGPRPVSPAMRPMASARPAPAPLLEPDDLAIESLETDEPAPAPPPVRAPRPGRATPPPAPPRAVAPSSDDILELVEDIDLPDLAPSEGDSVDLGSDLLQELEDEPMPVAARAGAGRPAPRSPAALRVVGEPSVAEEPLDLEEPIDLEEGWDPLPDRPGGPSIDVGALSPGQERTIDVPVAATVDGRTVRLNLKVTIRLSR
jgi:signal recognition particle receptor subunit beta